MTHSGDVAYSPPTMNRWQHEGAFVIRFSEETDPRASRFYGRIEHVASSQVMRFHSVDELESLLLNMLRRISGEVEQPEARITISENNKPSVPESQD